MESLVLRELDVEAAGEVGDIGCLLERRELESGGQDGKKARERRGEGGEDRVLQRGGRAGGESRGERADNGGANLGRGRGRLEEGEEGGPDLAFVSSLKPGEGRRER